MKGEKSQIKKAASNVGAELKQEKEKKVKSATDNVVNKGLAPKDLIGMSDSMVEGVYGQAYRLYNTGKYRDAAQLFRLLIMLNATEPKYAMGLAACYHMLKGYESAAQVYAICAMLDPESPVPHYHSSDCYLQMGAKMSAIMALEMALKRAGDKPQYATLKDRSSLTLASLRKELENQEKQAKESEKLTS
ncbi:MAG: CesD/SycD/LcrH family type III secretion system chaperone [Parachlamydia sp.]|nr:MAG: CesD/SycD/LcrH family type III secretion system chaperone [Parachlamydia sp.]